MVAYLAHVWQKKDIPLGWLATPLAWFVINQFVEQKIINDVLHTNQKFSEEPNQSQDVALYLSSLNDHPYAVSSTLQAIESAGLKILFKKFGDSNELCKTIEDLTRRQIKIKKLILASHGNKNHITLGSDTIISFGPGAKDWVIINSKDEKISDPERLVRCMAQLDSETEVILHTCQSMRDIDGPQGSIARTMGMICAGKWVIGCEGNTSNANFEATILKSTGKLKLSFNSPSIIERVCNVALSVLITSAYPLMQYARGDEVISSLVQIETLPMFAFVQSSLSILRPFSFIGRIYSQMNQDPVNRSRIAKFLFPLSYPIKYST